MRSLAEVKPDGTATIASRTWTDPRNRASIGASQPVLPGMPYDLRLAFMPRDYTVAAGHRLGLVVLLSDDEATLRPEAGTELRLDPAGTWLTAPLSAA